MTASLIIGDVRKALARMDDASIDVVMTSSPYWMKRAYLPDDDPQKGLEIGQEWTPGEFLETVLTIADEIHRVLAPWGTMWWNLGDTAGGSGGGGGDYNEGGRKARQPRSDGSGTVARTNKRRDRTQDEILGLLPRTSHTRRRREGIPLDKSVCWVPQLFGASLAYGRNLLTGDAHRQWITRPPVTWCKPTPSVGELIDAFRVGTELLIWGAKQGRYFFDLDAVRSSREYTARKIKTASYEGHPRFTGAEIRPDQACNPLGAPPLDWWEISPSNYNGPHYAVMPEALLDLPIRAAVPERVCTTCSLPWERLIVCDACGANGGNSFDRRWRQQCTCEKVTSRPWRVHPRSWQRPCQHDGWRPGLILDLFAGTGTTAVAAAQHGRDAILIDLDARNEALIRERVGLFMGDVTRSGAEVVA